MKKNSARILCLLVATVVSIGAVVTGCAGSQASPGAEESVGFTGQLPAFPVDDSTGRVASAQIQSVVDGSAFLDKTDGAVVNGMHLEITAAAGSLEYVIYRHEIGFETSLYGLTVDLTATGGEGAWIGIADFSTDLWQLTGPFTAQQVISVDTGSLLSTNFNNFFVAVIAFDGTFVDVASTTLEYESRVVPPTNWVEFMQPIFDVNCMPCHSSGSATSGIVLDSYWQAFDDADAALAKVLADHAPTGSGSMSEQEKDFFQSWVDGGKEYGEVVTYTSFIQPLTSNSCSPCHTGGGNSGGVNWDTYASAFPKGEAAWNRIKSNSMPQGGPALSDANKDKWLAWVGQGKPE